MEEKSSKLTEPNGIHCKPKEISGLQLDKPIDTKGLHCQPKEISGLQSAKPDKPKELPGLRNAKGQILPGQKLYPVGRVLGSRNRFTKLKHMIIDALIEQKDSKLAMDNTAIQTVKGQKFINLDMLRVAASILPREKSEDEQGSTGVVINLIINKDVRGQDTIDVQVQQNG